MAVKLFHKLYPHPNSDRYLIILHGLFGMLDNWHLMAGRLSTLLNVVTVDQRNHGHSPHTDYMDFQSMSEDLLLLMDDLGISEAVIMGHSMGGKTAMVFTDLHPNRVERLIVVDIAPREYPSGHDLYFKAFQEIDFSRFHRRSEADEALATIESNKAIRQFLLKNLQRIESGYQLKFNLKPIHAFYPKMIKALHFHWIISTPSLFLYGGKSAYVRGEDKEEIEELFSAATFVEIPDAGHWVHAEKPDAFFQAVKAFL